MSIYEINNGSYRAYRVAVGINGKLKQRYFGLSRCKSYDEEVTAYEAAVKQENIWLEERERHKDQQKVKAIPIKKKTRTACCTKVRGVQLKLVRSYRQDRVYVNPIILVCVSEGKKQCAVLSCGHKQAWKNAIKAYCDLKGIPEVPNGLLNKIPAKSQWNKVRRHYEDNLGWDVPDTALELAD